MTTVTGGQDMLLQLSARYTAFADHEAKGSSAVYEAFARAIAGSDEVLSFVATLPADRQQPNLLLAAIRHLHGVPASADHLIDIVRTDPEPIRALMLARTTQTNEPARCAVLLPLLARLQQPLALLEVGASAGLCLLPDRYGYDYGGIRLAPRVPASAPPPVFSCTTAGPVPIPTAPPTIAWRRGLDLNPIDVRVAADTAWLQTLVWPDQEDRAMRLQAALAIAQHALPTIIRGDLLKDVEPILAQAPAGATLVVFHTAVLAYVAPSERGQFADIMRRSGVIWISNEAPGVFPAIAKNAPPAPARGRFLLAINERPVAWTGPHGQSIDWFGD